MSEPITVLVIGYVWPEPDSSAAGRHMLSLLQLFSAQGWTVTFASPAKQTEHQADLTALGIGTQYITINDSGFDEFVQQLAPDIVLFDRFMMEEQLGWRVAKYCPMALRVLDTEDLQCLRYARQQAHKHQRSLQSDDFHSDIALREIASIYRCDLSLIISEYEVQLLHKTFGVPSHLVHYLPFMLASEDIAPNYKSFVERDHFVAIGNFRHDPNWDSVLFLQQIWPLIRAKLPRAELHIYGAYAPPKATALNNPGQGFLIKGRAENARDVIAKARVLLAPLRFGAGIKGKLMDAMLSGTPSVTTEIGAESMHGKLPWPGLVANTPQSIADAALSLYSNEMLWTEKQKAIQPLLQQRYCGLTLGKQLVKHLIRLKQDIIAHRLSNFTGAMLQHHSMKSTFYMAKWIETKTQLKQRNENVESQ